VKVFCFSILLLVLAGCWNPFAPEEGNLGGIEQLTLTEQRNPEEVLQNFRYAYIYRDSLVYSRILDTGFVFIYYDSDIGGSGDYAFWGRDTELRTTGRLFRAFDHFTLVWNATLAQDPAVITDSVVTAAITKTFDLSIGSSIQLTGNAVFNFNRDTTGTWRISRWQDESFN
jgi:hypothetical protein